MSHAVSPRSDDGVLSVAERWFVRGRFVATAATGALGIAAALGAAAVPAAPLLLLALVFAANTLAFALLSRHVDPMRAPPSLRLAGAIAVDLAAAFAAAPYAGALGPALRLAAALLAGAALATFVGAGVARRAAAAGAASAAAVEPWLVALAESVVGGVREPLGIVRARAEVLRLAIVEQPALHELAHDFDVLLERVAEAQRALLSVFALAPDRSARGRVELPAVAADAVRAHPLAARVAVVGARPPAPFTASHDAAAFVLRGMLDVAGALAHARGGIRLRLRAQRDSTAITLRFPLASAAHLRELDEGRVDGCAQDVAAGLALLLGRRVALRMGGELRLRARGRQGELALALPGDPPAPADAPGDRLARIPAAAERPPPEAERCRSASRPAPS